MRKEGVVMSLVMSSEANNHAWLLFAHMSEYSLCVCIMSIHHSIYFCVCLFTHVCAQVLVFAFVYVFVGMERMKSYTSKLHKSCVTLSLDGTHPCMLYNKPHRTRPHIRICRQRMGDTRSWYIAKRLCFWTLTGKVFLLTTPWVWRQRRRC